MTLKQRPRSTRVEELLASREREVADLLKQGLTIDQVMQRFNLPTSPGFKTNFTVALMDEAHHPLLFGALKSKFEEIVKQNEEDGFNTLPGEIARIAGLSLDGAKSFVQKAGVDLTPFKTEDARDAKLIELIRARVAAGESRRSILKSVGIGNIRYRALVAKGGITQRDLSAITRRPAYQSSLLRTILTTTPGVGEAIVGTNALIAAHPEFGSTEKARETAVKEMKSLMLPKMAAIVAEAIKEIPRKDWNLRLNRLLVAELSNPTVLSKRDFVSKTRRLVSGTAPVLAIYENPIAESVIGKVNHEYFGDESVCPYAFAVRLVRLGLLGDAGYVFHTQIPTPQRLGEVRTQLKKYSAAKYRDNPRPIHELATYEIEEAAQDFFYMVRRKLLERGDDVSTLDTVKSIRFILTGTEGPVYKRDYSMKSNRQEAVDELLFDLDGRCMEVTTRRVERRFPGLVRHYLETQGADTTRDVIIMAFREFGIITPEQERTLATRFNWDRQKELILRHFDPIRPYSDYEALLGAENQVVRKAMLMLSDELTDSIAKGETERSIADRLGVGAIGVSRIIQQCGVADATAQGGRRMVIKPPLHGIGAVPSEGPMTPREDMRTIEELALVLESHLHKLQGISEDRKAPPVSVEGLEEFNPLAQHLRDLTAACKERDFDEITALAGTVRNEDVKKLREVPLEKRKVIAKFSGTLTTETKVTDKNLDELDKTAEALIEEAKFR